jgi:lipopolysaccharide/colanic/teichoic acid biosynthesis glycosyltransferase
MNDVRRINKLLEQVNESMDDGQYFVGSFETYRARRHRISFYKVPVLRYAWIFSEFIFLRIFPKVPVLKQLYFALTSGKGRLLSKAEMLGRLVCCGFEIVSHQSINGITWFAAKKVKAPSYDKNASYGPLFKMRRIGKGGKIFHVLKFRTMHPYSEYLQDYVLQRNGYAESGKPADDFRLTPWGKFMRRYWLDELPQLINVLKGDMSVVGPRPLVAEELIKYGDYINHVLTIRPGITGLWQVSGRNDIPYPRRVQIDLHYVNFRNFWLDLWIILKTVNVVIMPKNKGAY